LKTLSANLQTEKAALQNAPCYAVRFDAATPIYLSNWDTSFVFDSHTYTPLIPIKKPSIRESGGSVQIGNVDDTFTSLLINGTLKKVDVYIYEIFFDADNAVVDGETLFSGSVDGQQINDQWATIALIPAPDGSRVMVPRRRIVPSCGFVFKSTECGYAGATTTCAKTYEDCGAKSNTAHFGGFRFIPKPGTIFSWGGMIITVE
jgi:hypothetical protein